MRDLNDVRSVGPHPHKYRPSPVRIEQKQIHFPSGENESSASVASLLVSGWVARIKPIDALCRGRFHFLLPVISFVNLHAGGERPAGMRAFPLVNRLLTLDLPCARRRMQKSVIFRRREESAVIRDVLRG